MRTVITDEYIQRMRENAAWAGEPEIRAAARVFHVNIKIVTSAQESSKRGFYFHLIEERGAKEKEEESSMYLNPLLPGESKKSLHLKNCLLLKKLIYEHLVIVHHMKECFIPNNLVPFLCGICSHMDEQETLFKRVQKSTCAKVMLFESCHSLGIKDNKKLIYKKKKEKKR